MSEWKEVGPLDMIELEDMIRFDRGDQSFVIYRTEDDQVYATDGYCTHERVHLSGGLIIGNMIECPKHNGRFDIVTGTVKRKPACIDLKTYPVKIEEGVIYIYIE